MPQKDSFFSLAELKQPVNQWLAIAFISLLAFWVVLYYFTQKTEAVAEGFMTQTARIYDLKEEIRTP